MGRTGLVEAIAQPFHPLMISIAWSPSVNCPGVHPKEYFGKGGGATFLDFFVDRSEQRRYAAWMCHTAAAVSLEISDFFARVSGVWLGGWVFSSPH